MFLVNVERLRQYILKANFATSTDLFSALECLRIMDAEHANLKAAAEAALESGDEGDWQSARKELLGIVS